jgi:hypothetical protein
MNSITGRLAHRSSRKTASLLFLVMYSNLLLPLHAKTSSPVRVDFYSHAGTSLSPSSLNNTSGEITKAPAKKDLSTGSLQFFRSKPSVGGPGQPEMASFQSVNNSDMVDLFSGDFSYNVPLMDVGGYPLNIHYTGGISMEQEASWVGLGWNLNPGAITRNMRGVPDDFNGKDTITKFQSMKENNTYGVTTYGSLETLGRRIKLGGSFGVFKNTYNGWGVTYSIGPSLELVKTERSLLNVGISLSANSQSGITINPSISAKMASDMNKVEGFTTMGLSTGVSSRAGLQGLSFSTSYVNKNLIKGDKENLGYVTASGALTFARPAMTPTIQMPITSESYLISVTIGTEFLFFHPNTRIEGYVNRQRIKPSDRIQQSPAYGYIYFDSSNGKANALLDINREKDGQFSYGSTPAIAMPQYTYDVYSISGEGSGGTVRPYRGDLGYVKDPAMSTKNQNTNLGVEFGGGNLVHAGGSIDRMDASTRSGAWTVDNDMAAKLRFRKADSSYQNVYFRNPGEKSSNTKQYYDQVGWDSLMRIKLLQTTKDRVKATNAIIKYNGLTPVATSTVVEAPAKKERDKRSQVVSWLNAKDAATFGLDTTIQVYQENVLQDPTCVQVQKISRVDGSVRKDHHLSEATVLNGDGRRYIYGLPVYNVEQFDKSFSVNKVSNTTDLDQGLAPYDRGTDDVVGENKKGKDNYFSAERIPAYAHSFLLTAILSPDYVDVSDNGITEDDLGDAIKFNYTRVYGPSNGYYSWRTPGAKNKASYNEGLKTYSRDDKASYFFGRKEVWYTHSIESKTMVALFYLSPNRPDAMAALDDGGGYDPQKQLRRLDSISLFSKSDLVKNGAAAKPIKTVRFEYSFDLCKGLDPDRPAQGKLTLKKIWFSYYNNKKEINNGYVFNYAALNPTYHPRYNDRWGTYKSQTGNPGGLNNADFPYSVQDSTVAANNASAWQLTDIRLPSRGRIKIAYESDDYAFVQNKKAMAMTSISGFGRDSSASPSSALYSGAEGFDYVFFNSSTPLNNKSDVYFNYLEGVEYLYLKVAVVMPPDVWGSGSELIPVYAKIVDYNRVSPNRFWVRLERVGTNSALTRSVFQFLRSYLPSKAYPGSESDDNLNFLQVIKMFATSIKELGNMINGFTEQSMTRGWCRQVEVSKSFARLNVPRGVKYGGGYRVKRVEIYDNWNAMSGKQESVYGQEYQYRTAVMENKKVKFISSGVASYEPMIGNEENPFRQPVPYQQKIAPMAPVDNLYLELPMGESYFPSAMVGYSKVRVRTIHTKTKSANGWQESQFYTTRDYPTRVSHTPLDGDAQKRYKPELTNFLKVYSVDRVTVSQGFLVELNDMPGKPKSTAIYAETDSVNPVSYTRTFYKDKWENGVRKLDNRVWVIDSANGTVDTAGVVGLDIEVMTDFRQVLSTSTTVGLNANYDGFFVPFLGYVNIPTLWKLPNFDESLFRSAAMVKVVQRYGIVDSLEVMDKGSVVTTRNLVFDGQSGEALLSRTKNNFNDPVFSFSYPAHWAYTGMGPAYRNIDVVLRDVKFMEGKLYYKSDVEFPVSRFFESGDELWVVANEAFIKVSSTGTCPVYKLDTIPKKKSRRIWAIDLAKTSSGTGIYFMDKDGRGYTGMVEELRIIRSGKRNMLGSSVGSVASMVNPLTKVNGRYTISISNQTKVLQASANSFSDYWKVENSYYQIDSCYQKKDTVYRNNLQPVSSMLLRKYQIGLRDQVISPSANVINSHYFSASIQGFRNRNYRTKSIIRFNLAEIPVNARVISATLSLDSYFASGIWLNNDNMKLNWDTLTKAHYQRGTNLSSRTNAAVLRNVSTNWNINTPFDLVRTGKDSVNVPTSANMSCDNKNLNVLPLISEAVANPALRMGFVFQLSSYAFSSTADELRALTFNSGWGPQFDNPKLPGNVCAYGAPPLLNLAYWIQKDTCVKLCKFNIADTLVNPYRWGILGNWRADRAYTYYGNREVLAFEPGGTDIRRQGAILDFAPYWSFNTTALKSVSDTTRWVWNAAQSRFNSRGFEVENFDALGRYNSGQYGYKQTMPVAVTQNARARETWNDGFEDYTYSNANCTACPKTRDLDLVTGKSGVAIDSVESHSGKYSLRVNGASKSEVTIPLSGIGLDSLPPRLTVQMDSVAILGSERVVVGLGNGMQGTYSGLYTFNGREIGWDGSYSIPNIDLKAVNFAELMMPFSTATSTPDATPRKVTIPPTDERFLTNNFGNYSNTTILYGVTKTINSTTDQDLYNQERWGTFSYNIPVRDGDYSVVLKFCELYYSSVGNRVFNVDINGSRVLSNFDMLTEAPKFTAFEKVFPATVTNGKLNIDFTSVVGGAKITAIDLIYRGQTVPSSVIPPTQAMRILPEDLTYITVTDGWTIDVMGIYGFPKTINGTDDQALYSNERFGTFRYDVPVTNGNYNVVLKFCEIYHNSPGKRVFNVDINGNRVLNNFDILSQVPKFTALDYTFPVTVTNGRLNISFDPTIDGAKITAIDIIPTGGDSLSVSASPGYDFRTFNAHWQGYVQPRFTDNYKFFLKGSGVASIRINGTEVLSTVLDPNDQASIPISMTAGQLYFMIVDYNITSEYSGNVTMSWASDNFQQFEVVPKQQLYTNVTQANGSLVPKVLGYCKSFKKITGTNMVSPKLSPLQSKDYIVSVWVKTEGTDGSGRKTAADAVTLRFNNNATVYPLQRTGVKIEGWQRMETKITMNATATSLILAMNATGSAKMYFDDLRIQPYNSSQKAYVYDPISLRLMAELDENNFATFYEYDDDGTLIRVKKETERGVQTIKETRSALIKN